ncbi:30S ribosomal protein S3 [Spiroplasma endosymbiont of Anurida maritima]|uniref:30S ribosomal protein S3 n=1 Tax=Spiroplasma endosymbiont of Anurida maritima TaxID=2967972 RepID=UPI0036D2691F
MGQKVSPNGFRVGIVKNWESRWYADKQDYAKWLHQDIVIRKHLFTKLKSASISRIEIERTKSEIVIFIKTARVGVVLGQEGKNIPVIIKDIKKAIKDRKIEIKINVVEIRNADVDAQLVANSIAEQIVNRASFRTVQKIAIKKALKAGAKGIKTRVSGRLGGVEMARKEGYSEGNVPLATLRSDIDYATANAHTTYGIIGVKVWIYKGEVLPGQSPLDISYVKKNQNNNNDRKDFRNKNYKPRDFKNNDRKPREFSPRGGK